MNLLFNNVYFNNQVSYDNLSNRIKLNSSGFWNLTGTQIYIDDSNPDYNWSKTAAENDWCSGSGTWKDPYIIENITIDGLSSYPYLIKIRMSIVFFILRNITLLNNYYGESQNAIYLEFVSTGIIDQVRCFNTNQTAIALNNAHNITFSNCNFTNNYNGIYLSRSQDIRIIGNNINHNSLCGISLSGAEYNVITGNIINNNGRYGIILINDCHYNTISGNTLHGNPNCITIEDHDNDNNTIYDNDCGALAREIGGYDIFIIMPLILIVLLVIRKLSLRRRDI